MRMGGDLEPVQNPLPYLQGAVARAEKNKGNLTARILIGADGKVTEVQITDVSSGGHSEKLPFTTARENWWHSPSTSGAPKQFLWRCWGRRDCDKESDPTSRVAAGDSSLRLCGNRGPSTPVRPPRRTNLR